MSPIGALPTPLPRPVQPLRSFLPFHHGHLPAEPPKPVPAHVNLKLDRPDVCLSAGRSCAGDLSNLRSAICRQHCSSRPPFRGPASRTMRSTRITLTNHYHLERIGFFRKYRATPVREGWQVTSNLGLICVHLCSSLRPSAFLFYVRTTRASCVRPQFSFPGVTALWRSRLSIRNSPNPPGTEAHGPTR